MSVNVFLLTVWICFTGKKVLCIPEVQYSFEPRCSQEINFTCTALGFNSAGISWFAGDTDLATYDFIRTDVYPLPVMTQSINATALIVHANFSTLFNYFNFTLSANITELLPFQGQNFTCGTTSMRSHALLVDHFEVLENNLNVLLKLQYVKEQLRNITATWTNSIYLCGITTNFTIELRNLNNESLIRQHFSSDMCHFNQCTASILSPPPSATYFFYILANNKHYEYTFAIESHHTKYINYSLINEDCGLQVNCVAVNNGGCTGSYFISENGSWHTPVQLSANYFTNLIPVLVSDKPYLVELYTMYQDTEISVYVSYVNATYIKLPEVINATFTAMYWNNGHLFEARVAWNITQISSCVVNSTYVQLQNSSGMILQKERIIMEKCPNNLCIISFNIIYEPSYDYVLYIKNDYTSLTSHTLIGSHHRSLIEYLLYFGTCYTSIQCITQKSDNCTIWLTNRLLYSMGNSSSNNNYIIKQKLNHSTTYYVLISAQINSTVIYVKGNFTTPYVSKSSTTHNELFSVSSSLFLVAVGILLTIFYLMKLKKSEYYSYGMCHKIMALVIVCMLLLCFLSWLLGFVMNISLNIKSDICEDKLILQVKDILIKVSTILTGSSILAMACVKAVSKFTRKPKKSTSHQITQETIESGIYAEPSCMKEESVQMQVNELYKIRSNKSQFAGANTINQVEPTYKNINVLDL